MKKGLLGGNVASLMANPGSDSLYQIKRKMGKLEIKVK
jgi:hypothetical protein